MESVFVRAFVKVLLVLAVVFEDVSSFDDVPAWTYKTSDIVSNEDDITPWTKISRSCSQYRTRGSPINIVGNETEMGFQTLKFNYDLPLDAVFLKNDYRWASVRVRGSVLPSVSGGPLMFNETYVLHEIRFHWGIEGDDGSEHAIGSQRYPVEMQLVHYRQSEGSYREALKEDHGVVMISFFIAPQHYGQSIVQSWEPLLQGFDEIISAGMQHDVIPPKIDFVLPARNSFGRYFAYNGGLPHPPCFPTVLTIVFEKPIYLALEQMKHFYTLNDEFDQPLVYNYRPKIFYGVTNYKKSFASKYVMSDYAMIVSGFQANRS